VGERLNIEKYDGGEEKGGSPLLKRKERNQPGSVLMKRGIFPAISKVRRRKRAGGVVVE